MNKKIWCVFIAVLCSIYLSINTYAAETDNNKEIKISIDSEPILDIEDDSEILTKNTTIENGIITITVVSHQSDGTIVTDKLSYSNIVTYSSEGSTSAKREKEIENWDTLTIYAEFSWRTEGAFAYVKCDSAKFRNQCRIW